MIRRSSSTGLGVSKTSFPLKRSLIAFLAVSVVPTSSALQRVCGTIPSFDSERKHFNRGTLPPSSPNQIRPSAFNSSNRFSVYIQHRPEGGSILRPDGVVIVKNCSRRLPGPACALIDTDCQGPLGSSSGFENLSSLSSVRPNRPRHCSNKYFVCA